MRFDACLSYTPVTRIDALLRSVPARAGTIVLDLEDSVPASAKRSCRERLGEVDLTGTGLRGVSLRINAITTPDGLLDLRMLLGLDARIGGLPVEVVLVPKVTTSREVEVHRQLLAGVTAPPEICSFIETVESVENALDIAAASDGLCFGQADLVAEMYAPDESYLAHARARLCVAAARYGLPAIDTNSFELWDMDVVREQAEAAKRCGFTGKAAIHPKQIDAIVDVLGVDDAELEHYRRLIEDYESDTRGFTVSKDRVLAPPFVLKARRTLARLEPAGRPAEPTTSQEDTVSTPITDIARQAMVDVSGYPTELVDGRFTVADDLTARLVGLVADGEGLAVLHGVAALLARHGMDIHREEDAAVARDHLEAVFRAFVAAVDLARYTPVAMGYDQVASMDVDGFNKNTSFTPNSDHTQSREFLTTKCVHFDAATTFIGNIYGPNTNITGGQPVVSDTRAFTADNGIDPADLVELMPHSYNVAVKQEYAERILAEHSVVVDVDLAEEMIMVVLNNEVAGGLAHAGSTPRLTDPSRPGKRPLRHIELQFADGANLGNWYRHYRLALPEVEMAVPEARTAEHDRYHRGVDAVTAGRAPVGGAGRA